MLFGFRKIDRCIQEYTQFTVNIVPAIVFPKHQNIYKTFELPRLHQPVWHSINYHARPMRSRSGQSVDSYRVTQNYPRIPQRITISQLHHTHTQAENNHEDFQSSALSILMTSLPEWSDPCESEPGDSSSAAIGLSVLRVSSRSDVTAFLSAESPAVAGFKGGGSGCTGRTGVVDDGGGSPSWQPGKRISD